MSKKERVESLDEIVFANKNKEYGAYMLRKIYPKHINISQAIAITILLLAVGIPLIAGYMNRKSRIIEDKTVAAEMMEMVKNEDAPPPPPPPPPPEALEQKVKFTAPIVVEEDVEEGGLMIQDELNTQTVNEAITEDIVVEETNKEEIIEQAPPAEIFTVVEESPGFPGGDESRIKFLQQNITYPQVAKEAGIQGTVFVTFVVEVDGSVSDVRVLRGIGGGCDEEAIRVVKAMPKWTPGKQRGRPVRVQFNMPIKFILQG
ncbi:MAG: energy transducer TonB [Lentimicrobiaceae bacterium]|nr:energy transducer TonB [Lentimicrobiaceae bacterium]